MTDRPRENVITIKNRSEVKVTVTRKWYATLHHPKMHPHTKFGIPIAQNIGMDIVITLCLPKGGGAEGGQAIDPGMPLAEIGSQKTKTYDSMLFICKHDSIHKIAFYMRLLYHNLKLFSLCAPIK